MAQNKTITINGRKYDAVTGLPVKEGPTVRPVEKVEKKPRTTVSATAVHSAQQRSKTLRRSATKRPAPTKTVVTKQPVKGRSMDIARSDSISKFAPHPVTRTQPKKETAAPVKDVAPRTHPLAERAAAAKRPAKKAPARKLQKPDPRPKVEPQTRATKDAAIEKALKTPTKKVTKKRQLSPWKKGILIGALCLGSVIGIGYAVYKLVPSVSVSIASRQAGVKASYPEYTPDGFSLHQPVSFSEGEVLLTFKSNSNQDLYTISQTNSSWDSSAVLDSIVRPNVGENYTTTQERGLTIYSYETNATWVNGGILYTIKSDSQLSNDQIRRIAVSIK